MRRGANNKGWARFLAGLIFFQGAFASASETDFWSRRRQYLNSPAAAPAALRTAGVPSELFALPRARILGQSPSVFFPTRRRFVPPASMDLSALLDSLPYAFGTVRRISPPAFRNPSGPVVVLIQDVHRNLEAQSNIGEALREGSSWKTTGSAPWAWRGPSRPSTSPLSGP